MERFSFDHDLHIHTKLSLCSKHPEQTADNILRYAKENGLKTVCITDHFWDDGAVGMPNKYLDKEYDPYGDLPPIEDVGENAARWYRMQNYSHISKSLPLPECDGVSFLFGAETELSHDLSLGASKEAIEKLDFLIIPTTHLHMGSLTLPKKEGEYTPYDIAKLWERRLDGVLDMNLPFGKIGIAHLACHLMYKTREGYLEAMRLLDNKEMERIFSKAAAAGVGIELNLGDMSFGEGEKDIILRPFKIAKAAGCKFYLGSDAHSPSGFCQAKEIFSRATALLGLTEEDKFHIKKN